MTFSIFSYRGFTAAQVLVLGMLSCSMLVGDGVITPPNSVLGALKPGGSMWGYILLVEAMADMANPMKMMMTIWMKWGTPHDSKKFP